MKVAVFENEYNLIDTIFDITNYYYFNNSFSFDYFPSSQSLQPFEKVKEYPIIIIDIDLSQKSELDGYALISKLNDLETKPAIIILTGHSKVEESLRNKSLPKLPVLSKPLAIEDLHKALKPYFKSPQDA